MKNIGISNKLFGKSAGNLKKKKKTGLLMCLVADLSVPVFPVQTGMFEQENNIPHSVYINTGDNIMLYTFYAKTNHTNYSRQSFITVSFPFADEKKIEVIVAVIMQKHPLSLPDGLQSRDSHSQ